ncbi:MAG: sodium:alanine symporter family protein [Candidatus Cloacimonadota bacterium]|nr:MAG: sodium:alanine symporter family protein [Candidatus Cloacimonadota bacterium]PIE77534.1 MAG: sodium:alanine symporter family protein [Candidatus Delongbacteria bacterium]
MSELLPILKTISNWVWGIPLLALLVGTGIYLSIRLGFLQIIRLPLALKYLFSKEDKGKNETHKGDVSSFAALSTALAATIGTGNIVGVATAISLGGPGSLFWMWVAAFFGMATKYAEGLLSIQYRVTDENGEMAGGPMYYLEKGLGLKWLGKMFALFGIGVAFFGIGTFPQVNAINISAEIALHSPTYVTTIIVTALTALVTLGGIKRIARVAEFVVPFAAILYVTGSVIILILNFDLAVAALKLVLKDAFTGTAASGGFAGATMMLAMRSGISRGVFSNESGLGSAPIATAAAKTNSCVRQGLITMTQTFFDTIIICTMTGLVLILTGVWNSNTMEGAQLTSSAFRIGMNAPLWGEIVVTGGLLFFAFTTILGWNYYGERCSVYLFGVKSILPYKLIFIALVFSGGFLKLEAIWTLADIVNGLMAIPNLIGILGLSGVIIYETKIYFENLKSDKIG